MKAATKKAPKTTERAPGPVTRPGAVASAERALELAEQVHPGGHTVVLDRRVARVLMRAGTRRRKLI